MEECDDDEKRSVAERLRGGGDVTTSEEYENQALFWVDEVSILQTRVGGTNRYAAYLPGRLHDNLERHLVSLRH